MFVYPSTSSLFPNPYYMPTIFWGAKFCHFWTKQIGKTKQTLLHAMFSTYNTMRDLQVIFFSHLIFANFRKHLHCYCTFLHATNFSSTTHGTHLEYHFKHPSLLEDENLCVVEAQIRFFSCWWTTLKLIIIHSMECIRPIDGLPSHMWKMNETHWN